MVDYGDRVMTLSNHLAGAVPVEVTYRRSGEVESKSGPPLAGKNQRDTE
jgi:hypothetical protein